MEAFLLALHRSKLRNYERLKRLFDLATALVLLILSLPVWMTIAVAIKLSSPGPVLFRHRRLGRYGREFLCLKFRTMVVGAETMLHTNPALRAEFERNYKLKDDPRATRLGAILRRTSLDELPQLWNVVRGEMSLIGPRPIVPGELARYGVNARKLFGVMPGVSGLWQTCGRTDITYADRVRLDLLYIGHRSTRLDLVLTLRTVATVLRRTGAY